MATCLLLTFHPLQSNAAIIAKSSSAEISKTKESAEVNDLVQRVNEIKAMDFSNLNPSERTNIRKELIAISHRLQDRYYHHHGVYISLGGVLIVLLILILILH